ncbi:MAG TPA: protein kinase [Coriobacteriia bacterium]
MDEALILGRYRPLAELGEGGHGAVDLAFDTKMARRVAIKRIPITKRGIQILSHTTGLKEARTAALLNHPNIVTVHEWDTDADEAFLIMEHVDGVSLSELLDLYAPLNIDEAAAVLTPIAEAMVFAHDNGVLHLDLKPDNVLVTRDGLVKVADFGVAALTNAAGQALSAGGTLGYMPPEQLRGEFVDVRTDVWAFAALAFQVLTGAVPFASDSIEGALFKAERTGVPVPGEFEPSLPRPIDDVLMTSLATDADDRHPDLRSLAADLMEHLGDAVVGRDSLRALVGEMTSDDEDADEDESLLRLGLWDRLATRSGVAERAVTAIAAGWLAWAGMAPLGFPWLASIAAVIVASTAGYFAPSLGLGAGLVVLAAGAFSIWWAYGLAVALTGALWWAMVGRGHAGAGAVPVFAPLAGVLHASPAVPVLAGFFLDGVWVSGAAGAGAGAIMVLTSIVSRGASLADVAWPALVAPLSAPWPSGAPAGAEALRAVVTVAAWGVAGVASSLGARRGTRLGALTGAVGAIAICAAALGPWMTVGSRMAPTALIQLGIASILVLVVIALGPPLQSGDADDQDMETR